MKQSKQEFWSPCKVGHKLVHGHRNKSYGSPVKDFAATMTMFRELVKRKYGVDVPFGPEDFPIVMQCAKLSREMHCQKRDNPDDGCGYWETYAWVLQDLKREGGGVKRKGAGK